MMGKKAKEPEGAILITKHPNGSIEEEILFRKSKKHPIDPNGVAYVSSVRPSKKKA